MNKFIQNTKLFFNKKPVRIVTALLVIAAIMTGVAFGVIALVNAFSDPCAKQPGTTWDKDLKVCVKDSCQMDNGEDGYVCKAKGKVNQCIAKDYCDYSGPEGQYSYDEDTCMCKLDCSSLGEEYQGFTTDGRTEVSMQLQSDGTYKPQPDNILYCGSKCEYSKYSLNTNPQQDPNYGGTGWCAPNTTCGQIIYDTNPPETYNSGYCLKNPPYKLCDGDNPKDVACENGNCISGPENTPLCPFTICGKKSGETNNRIACESLKDCYADGNIPDNPTYECIKNDLLKNKNIQNVGICVDIHDNSKSGTNKSCTVDECLDPDSIGENNKGRAVSCKDKKLSGISRLVPQCKYSLKPGKILYSDDISLDDITCASYGVCNVNNNKWQANPNKRPNDNCLQSQPEICSIGEDCELDDGDCCPYNTRTPNPEKPGKFFCCGSSLDEDNKNCFNDTNFPYSKQLLTGQGNLMDTIEIPKNTDPVLKNKKINDYNKLLRKQLNNSSSNIKDSNYASVFWHDDGTDKLKLKAHCGSFNGPPGSKPQNYFVVGDIKNSKGNISYCVPKQSECTITSPLYVNGSTHPAFGDIPICQKYGSGLGDPFFWSGSPSSTGYVTKATALLGGCNPKDKGCISSSKKCDITTNPLNTCLNIAKDITGWNNLTIEDNGPTKPKKCVYDIECDNTSYGFGDLTIPWTNLAENLKENKNGEKILSSNEGKIFKKSITQTPNAQTPYFKFDSKSKTCKGQLNGYPLDATLSPMDKYDTNCLSFKQDFNINLLPTGEFCQKGVNKYKTNECNN